jgi:hypothetical protein
MNILDFNKTYSTDDYPYGRLRCTATFGVEFKANKGTRTCFQTINPKTGRENAVKHSTYSHLIIPVQAENGHYEYMHFDAGGRRSMVRTFKFFANEQNFKAANVPNEAYNHMLAIALTSSAVSLAWLKFETTEERVAYRTKWYQPVFSKIQAMMKQNITAADFQELLSAVMNIPMSLSDKKDYIIDNNMCIGEDEWVIRKELNASTEAELDEIISNWEKAEALGVQ